MAYTEIRRHNGQLVEYAVRRSNMSITALARKLKVSRRSIYNWFTDEDLNVEIVSRIGQALEVDFSPDFPEISTLALESTAEQPGKGVDETQNSVYYWKEKYIALLEAHNEFLLTNLSSPPMNNYSSLQSSGFA